MFNVPEIDFTDEKLQWPAWKFGLPMTSLTGELYNRFNQCSMPLQEFNSFFHDVQASSREASTKTEFYILLEAKKEERKRELTEALKCIAIQSIGGPESVPKGLWPLLVQYFRNRSLAAEVNFFAEVRRLANANHGSGLEPRCNTKRLETSGRLHAARTTRNGRASAEKRTKDGRVAKASNASARYDLRSRK